MRTPSWCPSNTRVERRVCARKLFKKLNSMKFQWKLCASLNTRSTYIGRVIASEKRNEPASTRQSSGARGERRGERENNPQGDPVVFSVPHSAVVGVFARERATTYDYTRLHTHCCASIARRQLLCFPCPCRWSKREPDREKTRTKRRENRQQRHLASGSPPLPERARFEQLLAAGSRRAGLNTRTRQYCTDTQCII